MFNENKQSLKSIKKTLLWKIERTTLYLMFIFLFIVILLLAIAYLFSLRGNTTLMDVTGYLALPLAIAFIVWLSARLIILHKMGRSIIAI